MQIVWLATALALVGHSRPPAARLDEESLAYLAREGGAFPNPGAIDAPRLVLAVHEPYADDPLVGYAETLLEGEGITTVPPEDLTKLGLPTKPRVWMFADSAPCEAEVSEPYAQVYADGFVGLEVGYRLKPCTQDPAPVVYLGDTPPDLRWRPATVELSDPVDLATWKHPARATLESWGLTKWEGETPVVHARVVRAAHARELGYAHYRPGSSEECGTEDESIVVHLALPSGTGFTELPPVEEPLSGERLVGELVLGKTTAVVVAKLRFQMYLWLPSAPTTWTERRTGSYHDEEVAMSGWSVLENPCEP